MAFLHCSWLMIIFQFYGGLTPSEFQVRHECWKREAKRLLIDGNFSSNKYLTMIVKVGITCIKFKFFFSNSTLSFHILDDWRKFLPLWFFRQRINCLWDPSSGALSFFKFPIGWLVCNLVVKNSSQQNLSLHALLFFSHASYNLTTQLGQLNLPEIL